LCLPGDCGMTSPIAPTGDVPYLYIGSATSVGNSRSGQRRSPGKPERSPAGGSLIWAERVGGRPEKQAGADGGSCRPGFSVEPGVLALPGRRQSRRPSPSLLKTRPSRRCSAAVLTMTKGIGCREGEAETNASVVVSLRRLLCQQPRRSNRIGTLNGPPSKLDRVPFLRLLGLMKANVGPFHPPKKTRIELPSLVAGYDLKSLSCHRGAWT